MNGYRSQSPKLTHGGWIGGDATFGVVIKFGTKEFSLSCFNTSDIQHRSHKVAAMLSSHKKQADYAQALSAIANSCNKVLRLHAAARKEEALGAAAPSQALALVVPLVRPRIYVAGVPYQAQAALEMAVEDEPNIAEQGYRVSMSDNDGAYQNAATEVFGYGNGDATIAVQERGSFVTEEFVQKMARSPFADRFVAHILGNCVSHAGRKFVDNMKKEGMKAGDGFFDSMRSDFQRMAAFTLGTAQFQVVLGLFKEKWGGDDGGERGNTDTSAVLLKAQDQYFVFKKASAID
jgi:hypothetical protein